MTQKTEYAVRQLGYLDPAVPFRSPESEAAVDLRIQRILAMPLVGPSVRGPAPRSWARLVVRGLTASIAMAVVAVLMWASPADGTF